MTTYDKTCETCKHWKHHGPRATWGSCDYIRQHDLVEIYADIDGFGIHDVDADIIVDTHPNFGCNLWEQGETT